MDKWLCEQARAPHDSCPYDDRDRTCDHADDQSGNEKSRPREASPKSTRMAGVRRIQVNRSQIVSAIGQRPLPRIATAQPVVRCLLQDAVVIPAPVFEADLDSSSR